VAAVEGQFAGAVVAASQQPPVLQGEYSDATLDLDIA
jgi:hypothetical protein